MRIEMCEIIQCSIFILMAFSLFFNVLLYRKSKTDAEKNKYLEEEKQNLRAKIQEKDEKNAILEVKLQTLYFLVQKKLGTSFTIAIQTN